MKNLLEMKRCCAFCGKDLIGRADKKFCDDICRNNYAYHYNKCDNEMIYKINKSLMYNRNILRSITKRGRKIVKRQALRDLDFNFDVITGVHAAYKNREYKLLYDYAYKCINDEEVLVIKCYKNDKWKKYE